MRGAKVMLALLAAAAMLTASSLGQEPATPPAPRPAPPAEEREQAPPPADRGEASNASEDEFVPTEELQPDAAVTFPVDI